MDSLTQVKMELTDSSKKYAQSIEPFVSYRERNLWKYNIFITIYSVIIFLLVFTIIPLTPALLKDNIRQWIGPELTLTEDFRIPLTSFWLVWLLMSIVLILCVYLLSKIVNFVDKRINKHALTDNQIAFVYLCQAEKNLEVFLTNDRPENIDECKRNLTKYFSKSDFSRYFPVSSVPGRINFGSTIDDLVNKLKWISFSESTQSVIRAFTDFNIKVSRRIEQKIEIDKVQKWLCGLICYEFSKMSRSKKITLQSTDRPIQNFTMELLLDFSNQVNYAEAIEEVKLSKKDGFNKQIEGFFASLTYLFIHRNILVLFLSWLILITLVSTAILSLALKITHITFDSTILMGYLSAIIVGSATIVITIYNRKN